MENNVRQEYFWIFDALTLMQELLLLTCCDFEMMLLPITILMSTSMWLLQQACTTYGPWATGLFLRPARSFSVAENVQKPDFG